MSPPEISSLRDTSPPRRQELRDLRCQYVLTPGDVGQRAGLSGDFPGRAVVIAASGQSASARNVLVTERTRAEPPTRKTDVVASLTDLRVNLSVESARSILSRRL